MRTVNTENAWQTLHARLEKEALLPPARAVRISFKTLRWAAVLALLFAGALTVYFLTQPSEKATYVLIENSEAEQILVTTLHDGSTVFLEKHASLSYPGQFANDKRVVEMEGNALFDITRDPQRPFIIDTKHVTIEVLGTSFDVRTSGNTQTFFSLSVQRGQVKVTEKESGESMVVGTGETVRLEARHLQKSITRDTNQFNHYIEKMSFKDETLEQLLSVISRTTGHSFILNDKETGSRKLTVAFDNNSVHDMTELICLALQLNYEEQNDTTYIFKK